MSAKILEDRPRIDIDLIPNFYIFKPEIVNEFGIGAIHANLSYNMEAASGVLSELARKPELMHNFRIFNESTKEIFPDTAIGLNEKLISFIKCKELIKNFDFRNLNDKQKENLQIALLDARKKEAPELIKFPESIEELEEYVQKRNDLYDDAINSPQSQKLAVGSIVAR